MDSWFCSSDYHIGFFWKISSQFDWIDLSASIFLWELSFFFSFSAISKVAMLIGERDLVRIGFVLIIMIYVPVKSILGDIHCSEAMLANSMAFITPIV